MPILNYGYIYMHNAPALTSADKVPAEAVSEVMEHTVTMLLDSTAKRNVPLDASFTISTMM